MKELFDALVAQLDVTDEQARGGAGVLFRAAREKLGEREFERVLGGLPGIERALRAAPQSGGLARVFGGFASALGGGDAALLANVVSSFGQLGLTQDDAKRFVPVVLDYLRSRIGKSGVASLEKALRA